MIETKSKRNRDSIVSRIFTLSRLRTLPFSFRIDSKRAFVLFLSLSQSSIKACNRPLEKDVSLVDEIPAYSPYSPDVLRPLLRCNFLFNRARIEHREERGSRLSRYRRMGGRGGEGSSFSSPPPFPTCDPTEDRAVSTSLALFSTRHVRREEVKKWSGRAWKCTGAPWIPGERGGRAKGTERLFNIPQRWRTNFFFSPFLSCSPATGERRLERISSRPPHNRRAVDRDPEDREKFSRRRDYYYYNRSIIISAPVSRC